MSVDYGRFGDIVRTAGAAVSAAGAVGLAWKGRSSKEPSEQDVGQSGQRTGGLLAALAIASLWAFTRKDSHEVVLWSLLAGLSVACLASFLVFRYVVDTFTFDQVLLTSKGRQVHRQILGGTKLTQQAQTAIAGGTTVMDFFAREYSPELVWTRNSRAGIQALFVLAYIGWTASGTVALATVALLVGNALPKAS